jgi:hypothetical protein
MPGMIMDKKTAFLLEKKATFLSKLKVNGPIMETARIRE